MQAVVVDGWPVLRRGVAEVLGQCGVDPIHQAGTATEAIALAEAHEVDVVVFGLLPDMDAATALVQLRAVRPTAASVVLLDTADRASAIAALDAGASAVLSRSGSDTTLRDAVMRVATGQRYIAPEVVTVAFALDPTVDRRQFTRREEDVLRLLAAGHSNREIAAELLMGEATVKTHLRSIYDKLGVANRVQAASAVIERQLRER